MFILQRDDKAYIYILNDISHEMQLDVLLGYGRVFVKYFERFFSLKIFSFINEITVIYILSNEQMICITLRLLLAFGINP